MLLSATLVSGFAPTPVPCEPVCDWSTHDFKLVGKEMACVARDPDVDEYLFYTMEVGKCTLKSGNKTHAVFDIDVINGISFTNAPYEKVLMPSETALPSDMSNYVDKAVVLSYVGGDGKMHVHAGKLADVGADGTGKLVGERLFGRNHGALDEPVDCAIDEVAAVNGTSGVGYGMCIFDGEGRVELAADGLGAFTGAAAFLPLNATDLSMFEGVNAAVYTVSGDYEVFKIFKINNTHVAGVSYFSTRAGAWPTDFSPGEKVVEPCSIFIDVSRDPRCPGGCTYVHIVHQCICPHYHRG